MSSSCLPGGPACLLVPPVDGIRKYGPLWGPTSSSCGEFGLWPRLFVALWAEKRPIMLFWPILGLSCCAVVPLFTFSITIKINFFYPKNAKKFKQSLKIS